MPFELSFLLICVLALAGISIVLAIDARAWKKRALAADKPPKYKAKLISDHKHGLAALHKDSSGSWHWRCECNQQGSIKYGGGAVPTEERAILKWKDHVRVHETYLVHTHEHSHALCDQRFVGLWSLFERYRQACYCQSANNDLILLNQEAKQFEVKGVQEHG